MLNTTSFNDVVGCGPRLGVVHEAAGFHLGSPRRRGVATRGAGGREL